MRSVFNKTQNIARRIIELLAGFAGWTALNALLGYAIFKGSPLLGGNTVSWFLLLIFVLPTIINIALFIALRRLGRVWMRRGAWLALIAWTVLSVGYFYWLGGGVIRDTF